MDLTISDLSIYFLLLLALWLLFTNLFRSSTRKPIRFPPPSPPALPFIGHLHLLRGPGLSKSFQTLAARYGPLMQLRMASATAVVVSNAATAKEMLKDNEMNFVSRPDFGSSSSDHNIFRDYRFVFAEYGEYWRFMKKLCMTQLLSVPQLNWFADIRTEEEMKLMRTLVDWAGEGRGCDLGKEITRVANNVVSRMAMSTGCSRNDEESERVWEFVHGIEELLLKFSFGEVLGPVFSKLDLFGFGKKLRALLLDFDAFVGKILSQHEMDLMKSGSDEKRKKDIMDILLEICGDERAEIKLTRMHIKSFLLEIFMAGTQTTSVALQWAMAELINNPKVFMKLREEINTAVGTTRLVEESDVPNLPYLQAVVKETLRLHPSAPLIFRRCEQECKINGYDLSANERIIINLHAIMRDPGCWEIPLEFIPERFLANHGEQQYDRYQMDLKGQNFALLPFGSGRRGCPGASLALSVIHGTVALLVQCFDFKVEGGEGKLNMEEGTGFSSAMANPLWCCPVVRFHPFAN